MLLDRVRDTVFPHYTHGFGEMTYSRAARILNLSRGDSIAERYRIMARINHPDLGGSPYLLEKVNQAKKYLDVRNARL